MSKRIERSMWCGCDEVFFGYGRGVKGEELAIQEIIKNLQNHQCLPHHQSKPILHISGTDLDKIIDGIQEKMPDVTITRHTV